MATDEADQLPQPGALERGERTIATVLGILIASAGVAATFVSENQAGTVAIIVVGGALLLIGIQGTPLIRVGGETASVELERRRRKDIDLIAQVAVEQGAKEAVELADNLARIDPTISQSPAVRALEYQRTVLRVLLSRSTPLPMNASEAIFDAYVETPNLTRMAIETKYVARGSLGLAQVTPSLLRLPGSQAQKYLLVTNGRPTQDLAVLLKNRPEVRLITWNIGEEESSLIDALK
jgi:hypothetical protein